MLSLESQILKESQRAYKDLIDKLGSNCNSFDIANELEAFKHRFDESYIAIDKMIKMNAIVIEKHKTGNRSLDLVIDDYRIDFMLNEEKAKKWLVNALILVIMNKNTYNGLYFSDGIKNTLKHDIIKHG